MTATSCIHDSTCPHRSEWCETLDALTQNKLKTLRLNKVCDDEMAKGLGSALKITTSLTEVILPSIMTFIGAQAIADGLRANSTLQWLWVLHERATLNSHISTEGIRALTDALQSHPSLTDFMLDNNPLGVEEAKQFSTVLRTNTSLQSLTLSRANLKDSEALEILEGLNDNVSLSTLSLHENEITDASAPAIATTIRKTSQLIHLKITHNPIAKSESFSLITEALYQNSSILHPFIIPSSYSSPCYEQEQAKLHELAQRNGDNVIARAATLFQLLLPLLRQPETAESSEPIPMLEEVAEPPALAPEEVTEVPAQPEAKARDLDDGCTIA